MNNLEAVARGSVAMVGIPWDENSSFLHGAAKGPDAIRNALRGGSMNLCAEDGTDLDGNPRFLDLGDLSLTAGTGALEQIEASLSGLLEREARILSLGGDHAVTYPILRAFAGAHENLTVLHLDAHPDLYQEYEGNRHSHASPFARVMEEGLAVRLVQAGIRTLNPHQRAQAERFDVEVLEMKGGFPRSLSDLNTPLYLSLDLDVLDPAFAPGVSHHEPGGPSTREVIRLIQNLKVPLVGADLVELNPDRDPTGVTAMAAAKLVKELAAGLLKDGCGV